jgi:nucleotide-binding universal stress UspA family protein
MDRALAIVDDTDQHRDLIREAGELAAGVGAELVLLTTMSRDEYSDASEALAAIEHVESVDYGEDPILEAAGEVAEHVGDDALEGLDVQWTAAGAVIEAEEGDDEADTIIEQAQKRDCDHIFMTGRRRSPTGKAVFGDTAQSVILNFDGFVTVTTA